MAILITGATGFLGTALVERLAAHGERHIRCLVRPSSDRSKLEALGAKYPQACIQTVEGSLADRGRVVDALNGAEAVYHLAAGMRGSAADIFLNSVVASRHLLDAVEAARTPRVVLISSFSVYGVAGLPRRAVVNEDTPLEEQPEKRDFYAYGKLRQEQLFREYQSRCGFQLIVLRPGVIYGEGGTPLSTRVGIRLPGIFLHCGGRNPLPLSYVENCAEAVALAGRAQGLGQVEVFNVHDDDLPNCAQYLHAYRRQVERLRSLRVPYFAAMGLSRMSQWYHIRSRGQLPAVLTPYKSAALWKGNCFDNRKIKAIGWKQLVPTAEGLKRSFEFFRNHSSGS